MKAFISSESPVKHAAVEVAFDAFDIQIETIASPQESGVSEQPQTIKETCEGANNRHAKLVDAIGKKANGHFLVTIESGIDKLAPGLNDFGVEVVIVEKDGERRVGVRTDIEFPPEMTAKVPSVHPDLGVLVQQEYGAKTKDPYPYFTYGRMNRSRFIESALVEVLSQFEDLAQKDIEALGDYEEYIARVKSMLRSNGVRMSELVQCDMVNYECSTNEHYDDMKTALLEQADLVSETMHAGRLISIFRAEPQLRAGDNRIPYIELLQPKPTRENRDGIDGIFFVTTDSLDVFIKKHQNLAFDIKGLNNEFNPYVELKLRGVSVKFHDRHMGTVLAEEQKVASKTIKQPTYGGHITL